MAVPQEEDRTENRPRGYHSRGKASMWSNYLTDWKQSCAGYEAADPDSVDYWGVVLNSETVDEQMDFLDAEVFRGSDWRIGVRDQR